MDNEVLHTVSMEQFRELFPVSSTLSMGNDLCIADFRYDGHSGIVKAPCRFDGFLIIFCISGRLELQVNLSDTVMEENSLLVALPGDVIRFSETDAHCLDGMRFILMAMTRGYIAEIRTDIKMLMEKRAMLMQTPCFTLSNEEKKITAGYLSLAYDVMRSNLRYKRECIGALVASVFHLAGGVIEQKSGQMTEDAPSGGRSKEIFDSFMTLVSEHYCREHALAFYADELCLTPKYLSKAVKAASGSSAPYWIDAMIVLEAKNLLRYSDATVKEIAMRLNFPNVSTFHKFFKAKTGHTPVSYRNAE